MYIIFYTHLFKRTRPLDFHIVLHKAPIPNLRISRYKSENTWYQNLWNVAELCSEESLHYILIETNKKMNKHDKPASSGIKRLISFRKIKE